METLSDVFDPLLDFWFDPADPNRPRTTRWFSGDAALDDEIRERFAALYDRAAAGTLDDCLTDPLSAVALVVALDQLPRHLFRGTAAMFQTDARARKAARVALCHEDALPLAHRAALYLCLTHAEDRDIVAEAVARFDALVRSPLSRGVRRPYKRMRASARKHLRTLDRFGRYPHRNDLLGRKTTEDEASYLAGETSRFVRSVRPHRTRRLKILVLHSFRQSGARLARRMKTLTRHLEDIAEFVFVDAPHPYVPDDREQAMLEEDFGTTPDFSHQRCWWNATDGLDTYHGWEASLRHLDAHLPADGVIGFSQGGAVTGLFAALRATKLRFVVCISGFPSRATDHQALTQPDSIDLPSLHIYGEQDVLMDHARTLALAGLFVDPEIVSHPGGHFFPDLWPKKTIRDFLLRFAAPPVSPTTPLHDWDPDLSLDAITPRLAGMDLASTLWAARSLRRPVSYGGVLDLTDPRPGDLAHRIWLAVWQRDPTVVHAVLQADTDPAGLVRLAIVATALLEDPEPLLDAIAGWFAAHINDGDQNAALAAPRPLNATDQRTALGRRIARKLSPDLEKPAVYIDYRRRIVSLSERARARRRRARGLPPIRRIASPNLSSEITRPRPMPVIPSSMIELAPLLSYLKTDDAPIMDQAFPRGTITPDGRLDLCKQVVGPKGIGPLLAALSGNHHVDRLLLGNNVIGPGGAQQIASFIRSGDSHVHVWYIAGNEIDAAALTPICEAVVEAGDIDGLWLKRNPLQPAAGPILARMLQADASVQTLDLVNTGLLDAGALPVIASLWDNTTLKHLYLGTNGLTPKSAALLGRYLAEVDRLESLYISCNRLGDDGVRLLAGGLRKSRSLKRLSLASNRIGPDGTRVLAQAIQDHPGLTFLSLGWTRATQAVGEAGNHLGDAGMAHLADLLRTNQTLRVLDVSHNGASQRGLDHLRRALADNTTLLALRCPQMGKATNPDRMAQLRGHLHRNRQAANADAEMIEDLRTPRPTRDVLSVYRTQPTP